MDEKNPIEIKVPDRKKTIIALIVFSVLALAAGIYLYKISPQDSVVLREKTQLDLSKVKSKERPRVFSDTDHFLGNIHAQNVFIVFLDMEGPESAAFKEVIQKIPKEFKDTALVIRHYPQPGLHKNSVVAAFALEAAAAQGHYWEMFNILLDKQKVWESLNLPVEKFMEYAKQIGIPSPEEFKKSIVSGKFKPEVERDMVEVLSLNLQRAPSFYFNNVQIKPASLEAMKAETQPYFKPY